MQKKCIFTHRRAFTLIELLAVIAIIGALALLILPKFTNVENVAKEGVSGYNATGLLRFLEGYQGATGQYPFSMHTGLNEDGSKTVRRVEGYTETVDSAMAEPMLSNMEYRTTAFTADDEKAKYRESLAKGGVKSVYYGSSGIKIGGTTEWATKEYGYGYNVLDKKYPLRKISKSWLNSNNEPVLARGNDIGQTVTNIDGYGVLVPLYVTESTLLNVQSDNTNNGRFMLASAPISPTSKKGDFGYYTVLFYAFSDGKPAYIYTIISPEGRSLGASEGLKW